MFTTAMYNPYSARIMSDWAYPFPIPNETLTPKELKAMRKFARKERARMLKNPEGVLTPVVSHYNESCQQGQVEVHRKHSEYMSLLAEEYIIAQALIDSDGPLERPYPTQVEGEIQTSIGRQLTQNEIRRATESEKALERHAEAVNRAQATVRIVEKNRRVVDSLASMAIALWDRFASKLFQWHKDFAIGSNTENPTLAKMQFTPYLHQQTIVSPSLGTSTRRELEAPPNPGNTTNQTNSTINNDKDEK